MAKPSRAPEIPSPDKDPGCKGGLVLSEDWAVLFAIGLLIGVALLVGVVIGVEVS